MRYFNLVHQQLYTCTRDLHEKIETSDLPRKVMSSQPRLTDYLWLQAANYYFWQPVLSHHLQHTLLPSSLQFLRPWLHCKDLAEELTLASFDRQVLLQQRAYQGAALHLTEEQFHGLVYLKLGSSFGRKVIERHLRAHSQFAQYQFVEASPQFNSNVWHRFLKGLQQHYQQATSEAAASSYLNAVVDGAKIGFTELIQWYEDWPRNHPISPDRVWQGAAMAESP